MTNYNDGNWHGWNGGECPVHPESLVDVVWENAGSTHKGTRKAGDHVWSSRTIVFRVVKEHREPRVFYMSLETGQVSPNAKDFKGMANVITVREVIE